MMNYNTIILVHHAKKGFEMDPQDSISGTNGIAGTADTNLILKRHSRYESLAVFSIGGRDVTARELQLWLKDTDCIWEKVLDSQAEKDEQRIPKLIKDFLEKEKTFMGTVTKITDRARSCVWKWVSEEKLKVVKLNSNVSIVPKQWLLEFMLTDDFMYNYPKDSKP